MAGPSLLASLVDSARHRSDESTTLVSTDVKSKSEGKKNIFAEQLLQCLDDSAYKAVIGWTANRQSVVIHNWDAFCTDVIPRYFSSKKLATHEEHNKVKKRKATFLKQTNNYGFTAIHNIELNSCSFSRPDFRRDDRAEALKIDPRARPAPARSPAGKMKTPLLTLAGENGSEVITRKSTCEPLTSLKCLRHAKRESAFTATPVFEDPPIDPHHDGRGRKRCNHAEKTNMKHCEGLVTATCLDKCGSTIRQCPSCSEWANHNNFNRHQDQCTAPAGTPSPKEIKRTKNVATMTTTTKTVVTQTITTTTTVEIIEN